MGFKSHICIKKKTRSHPGSPEFGQAIASSGLLLNSDRSCHQVDPLGRIGPGLLTMMSIHC